MKTSLRTAGAAEVDRIRFTRLYQAAGRVPAPTPVQAIRRRAGIA